MARAFGKEHAGYHHPNEMKNMLGDKFYSWVDCYNPPRGALVFFSASGEDKDYGHIGIYLGSGKVAHAYKLKNSSDYVREESISEVERLPTIVSYIGWAYPPEEWISGSAPVLSHPWPMSGHDAQNTYCSPYEGPGIPSTKRVIGFDDLWINSGLLVSSDATIYLSGQKTDATTIIAIEPEGNWRKLTEIPGIGRLEAISPQGTLYVMVWQGDSGEILALDFDGTKLWRSPLPASATSWTWLNGITIGPEGTIYTSCWDQEHASSSLTAFHPDGNKRWTLSDAHSNPAIAINGTVYVVMEEGKVCAYDSQRKKQWDDYDGRTDWPEYYDDVNYLMSIGSDGTVYVLPNMQGMQDVPYARLIALVPPSVKKWHADIPMAFHSQYDALYGPTIDTNNSLYIVEHKIEGNVTLLKVNSDGEVERFAGGNFIGSPIVDCNGTVYIGDTTYPLNLQTSELPESKIIAFNPDGSVQWISKLFNYDHIWPFAIGPDKIIYARGQRSLPDHGLVDDIVIIGSAGSR